jgi:SAM-dependent methyltransferase
MLDDLPVGIALDVACGTGRHARYLAELGHRVIGVDSAPAMLDRAATNAAYRDDPAAIVWHFQLDR